MDKLKKYLPLVGLIAFFVLANVYKNSTNWMPSTFWSIGLGLGMGLTVATGVFLYFYKYAASKIEDDDWAKVMEWGHVTTIVATCILLLSSIVSGLQIPFTTKIIEGSLFDKLSTACIWVEAVSIICLLSVPVLNKLSGIVGTKLSELFKKSSTTPTSTGTGGSGSGSGSWIIWLVLGIIFLFMIVAGLITFSKQAYPPIQPTKEKTVQEVLPGYTPVPQATPVTDVHTIGPDEGMLNTAR